MHNLPIQCWDGTDAQNASSCNEHTVSFTFSSQVILAYIVMNVLLRSVRYLTSSTHRLVGPHTFRSRRTHRYSVVGTNLSYC
jgi:hypothetical protein